MEKVREWYQINVNLRTVAHASTYDEARRTALTILKREPGAYVVVYQVIRWNPVQAPLQGKLLA